MADGVAPAGGANEAIDTTGINMPPTNPKQMVPWLTGKAIGGAFSETLLETNPEWANAIAELGMTEEEFADLWGSMFGDMLKGQTKMVKALEDDEDKCATAKAFSG